MVWRVPTQSITFNFGGGFNATAAGTLKEWNGVNTPLQYQQSAAVAQTCANDGFNSAGWGTHTSDDSPFGDALAITKRWYVQIGSTWYLREADIVLDQSRSWQVYSGSLRLGVNDFHPVMLHELGHVLDLAHPDQAGRHPAVRRRQRQQQLEPSRRGPRWWGRRGRRSAGGAGLAGARLEGGPEAGIQGGTEAITF